MALYLALNLYVSFMSICLGLGLADIIGRFRGKHFGRVGTAVCCATMPFGFLAYFSLMVGHFLLILMTLLLSMLLAGSAGAGLPLNKYGEAIKPKS